MRSLQGSVGSLISETPFGYQKAKVAGITASKKKFNGRSILTAFGHLTSKYSPRALASYILGLARSIINRRVKPHRSKTIELSNMSHVKYSGKLADKSPTAEQKLYLAKGRYNQALKNHELAKAMMEEKAANFLLAQQDNKNKIAQIEEAHQAECSRLSSELEVMKTKFIFDSSEEMGNIEEECEKEFDVIETRKKEMANKILNENKEILRNIVRNVESSIDADVKSNIDAVKKTFVSAMADLYLSVRNAEKTIDQKLDKAVSEYQERYHSLGSDHTKNMQRIKADHNDKLAAASAEHDQTLEAPKQALVDAQNVFSDVSDKLRYAEKRLRETKALVDFDNLVAISGEYDDDYNDPFHPDLKTLLAVADSKPKSTGTKAANNTHDHYRNKPARQESRGETEGFKVCSALKKAKAGAAQRVMPKAHNDPLVNPLPDKS
ncbi:hypothetical protein ACH42_11905 [Endozoicomonas sp. (ex Bugula neritina AB1)]|nr:hypothetical protein ACH42_11905 [Endozoicomonas sp. (ex Bugula neritina AB1)]